MNRILKWISITVIAVLLGAVLIRALGSGRNDPPDQGDEDTIHAPSHVLVQNGNSVVTLSAKAQKRAGITLATLEKAKSRKEATAPAMVLVAQELATLRDKYVAGQNLEKKAEIALDVDRREYQRLKGLYAENQNVSAKALQAAQGQLLSDQADLGTARQQLELDRAGVRQSWGGVLADWVAADSPPLERVLDQRDVLVEVTIPAGRKFTMPRTLRLAIPAGGSITASLVSAFPRVDPRIQGVSLLYLAPARPGLVPGVHPVAHFAAGRLMNGVVVPRAAVVWWRGDAWVYQEISPGHFVRRQVPTGTPVRGGYFVTEGLAAGEKIVASGAQTLLSEEFRSEIQPEG